MDLRRTARLVRDGLLALLVLGMAAVVWKTCSADSDGIEEAAPAPERPPRTVLTGAAKDGAQKDIVDALDHYFRAAGAGDAMAAIADDDLMIMTPPGNCDAKLLGELRKTLTEMGFKPANAFATIQCNGGPILRLR